MIFNNGEGNIFKIIPGPGNANPNTLDEFIATKHKKMLSIWPSISVFLISKLRMSLH